MRRYLLILFMFFGGVFLSSAFAQTRYYKTTQFAIKYKVSGVWGGWSDWKSSSMKVKIDLDDDIIVIYSEKVQVYRVVETMGSYTDESGGKQVKYFVVDQDDDNGYVRLRIERNGNAQIYIDFADVMWVYNVVRIDL